jgi:hypothetical protein
MYKDSEYWSKEAEDVVNRLGIRYSKVTSGYAKGEYNASVNNPKEIDEQPELYRQWKESNFGCIDIKLYNQYSRPDKEKAKATLILNIGTQLRECDYRKNKQYFSDIYKYYNKYKDDKKSDVYFYGEVGRDNVDYFNVLNGVINNDNWRNRNILQGKTDNTIGSVTNFKELYYALKSKAGELWLKKNIDYKRSGFDEKKLTTFIFDADSIPEIAQFEKTLEEPIVVEKVAEPKVTNNIEFVKNIDISKLKNTGFIKVGFRKKEFLSTNLLVGRERNIIFPDNESRQGLFAVVDIDNIIASHNEETFANSENYPIDKDGRNVNDRNYLGDKNAQQKVVSVSQNFNPEIVISTNSTASGTPIITIDGIVVSGNNRTMSLKLALKNNKEQYENYKKTLYQELVYGGYGISMSSVYDKIKNPILVRFDTQFDSYNSTELNKYNKPTKKSERQIDLGIRLSQQFLNNEGCKNSLITLVSSIENVNELYNNKIQVLAFKKILLDCGIINENELSGLFTDISLTENGKVLYETLLLSLVLSPKSIEVSQNNGVKSVIKSVVNAIIPLVKNKSFEKGSIIDDINNAILLQNAMVSTGFKDVALFIGQSDMFENDINYKTKNAVILNWFINQNLRMFKESLVRYNDSLEQNLGESLFGNNLTPEEIFDAIFTKNVPISVSDSTNSTQNVKENIVSLPNNNNEKELLEKRISVLKRTLKYQDNDADRIQTENTIKSLEKTIKYL